MINNEQFTVYLKFDGQEENAHGTNPLPLSTNIMPKKDQEISFADKQYLITNISYVVAKQILSPVLELSERVDVPPTISVG